MRLELLKCLKEKNLGLPRVEYFARKEVNYRHSLKFKSKINQRQDALISDHTHNTLKDACEEVRETALMRSKLRKRLIFILRYRPNLKKRIFDQLERERESTVKFWSEKNAQKIEHLEKKFKTHNPNKYQVPPELKRYETIKIYEDGFPLNKFTEK